MIVVDASVWVSRYIPNDLWHVDSRGWLEQYMGSGRLVIAPALLLAEVAGAVARRMRRPHLGHRAAADLLKLPTVRLLPVDNILAQAAATLAADFSLRGPDAAYVAAADRLGIPLVTWDQEQHDRAGTTVATYTPRTAPR